MIPGLTKKSKLLLLAIALGIGGFSAYGIYNTVRAYGDITSLQNNDHTLTMSLSLTPNQVTLEGPLCPPSCGLACAGCVSQLYRQRFDVLPYSTVRTTDYH